MPSAITSGNTVIVPDLIMLFTDEVDAGNIVHPVISGSTPDVTLRPSSVSTGTLRMFFMNEADCAVARDAHMQPAVFSITSEDMPWLPSAYIPNGKIRRIQQENPKRWMLEVDYQEVGV